MLGAGSPNGLSESLHEALPSIYITAPDSHEAIRELTAKGVDPFQVALMAVFALKICTVCYLAHTESIVKLQWCDVHGRLAERL